MRARTSAWYCGATGKVPRVVSRRASGAGISNRCSLVGTHRSWRNGEGRCRGVKHINGDVLGIRAVVFCVGYRNDLWTGGSRCKLIAHHIGATPAKGASANTTAGCCHQGNRSIGASKADIWYWSNIDVEVRTGVSGTAHFCRSRWATNVIRIGRYGDSNHLPGVQASNRVCFTRKCSCRASNISHRIRGSTSYGRPVEGNGGSRCRSAGHNRCSDRIHHTDALT